MRGQSVPAGSVMRCHCGTPCGRWRCDCPAGSGSSPTGHGSASISRAGGRPRTWRRRRGALVPPLRTWHPHGHGLGAGADLGARRRWASWRAWWVAFGHEPVNHGGLGVPPGSVGLVGEDAAHAVLNLASLSAHRAVHDRTVWEAAACGTGRTEAGGAVGRPELAEHRPKHHSCKQVRGRQDTFHQGPPRLLAAAGLRLLCLPPTPVVGPVTCPPSSPAPHGTSPSPRPMLRKHPYAPAGRGRPRGVPWRIGGAAGAA